MVIYIIISYFHLTERKYLLKFWDNFHGLLWNKHMKLPKFCPIYRNKLAITEVIPWQRHRQQPRMRRQRVRIWESRVNIRAPTGYGLRQWETTLHCNGVSRWLKTHTNITSRMIPLRRKHSNSGKSQYEYHSRYYNACNITSWLGNILHGSTSSMLFADK